MAKLMWIGGDYLDESRSTLKYIFFLYSATISWPSKKQSCIAFSTMESEYIAYTTAVQKLYGLEYSYSVFL